MAEVTGFTAARMLAMEDATIINANLVNYELILLRKDGTPINVGNVRGAQGLQGIQGPPVPMATEAEVIAGTRADVAVAPAGLAAKVASTTVPGIVRLTEEYEGLDELVDDIAVTPAALQNAITSAFEQGNAVVPYTPTLSVWTLGTTGAEISGWYIPMGKHMIIFAKAKFGTGATFTAASPRLSFPPGWGSIVTGEDSRMFLTSVCRDASPAAVRHGRGECPTTDTLMPVVTQVAGAFLGDSTITSTTPFTWAAGDWFIVAGIVRTAASL